MWQVYALNVNGQSVPVQGRCQTKAEAIQIIDRMIDKGIMRQHRLVILTPTKVGDTTQ